MKLSIVQNFIINKEERLNVLADDIISDVGNFFDDCDFYVNYNSEKNFNKVYSLYKKTYTLYQKISLFSINFNIFLNIYDW